MSTYTVKQIAKAAGVSVRTLHHYHEIGLLAPRHMGAGLHSRLSYRFGANE